MGKIEIREYADGSREWYRHGRLHREDGPAIERADGSREWWRDGARLAFESVAEQAAGIMADLSEDLTSAFARATDAESEEEV